MPGQRGGGGSVSQILTIKDRLGVTYKNLPYNRHDSAEPRLIHFPGFVYPDCVFEGPDDADANWPIGEIATFHDDSYPEWVTTSKRTRIDIDDTDVAADKEKDYFTYVTNAAACLLPLESIRASMSASRICNRIAQTGIARRFKKIDFAMARVAEYPNYSIFRDSLIHWCELVAEKPNGPLYGFLYVHDTDANSSTDNFDVTDVNVIDLLLDRCHSLLDAIDADSDLVKIRLAMESLDVGGVKGAYAVRPASIDPARVDVYKQMAIRKDDPDVSDRTAQYPNLEESGTEKVKVYARFDRSGLVQPDPYLLTLLRPGLTFDHDNRGDDPGGYGMYQLGVAPSVSDQRESFASYYTINGTHTVEQFGYNQSATVPVELTKIFPHLIFGARALQDSAQGVDKMLGALGDYVEFDVPITHFGEVTLRMLEESAHKPVSFKS
jgi:hypothetical protein